MNIKIKFTNNDQLNSNNKLIINNKYYVIINNLKNYKNKVRGLQAHRFQNCFKDILDQCRSMD